MKWQWPFEETHQEGEGDYEIQMYHVKLLKGWHEEETEALFR